MRRSRTYPLATLAMLCWLAGVLWPGGAARAATVTCPSAALGEALNIVTTSGVTTCTNIGTAKATAGIEIYNSLVAGCLPGGCGMVGSRFGVSFRRINSGSNEQPTLAACTGGCTSLIGTNAPVDVDNLFGESSSGVVRDWEFGIGVTTMVGCLTNSDSCSIAFQFADGTAGSFLVPQGSTTIPPFSFGGAAALPPVITAVTPSAAPNDGSQTVVVTGSNFDTVTAVDINLWPQTFQIVSSSEIRFAPVSEDFFLLPLPLKLTNPVGAGTASIVITPPIVKIATNALPQGSIGTAYSASIATTDGTRLRHGVSYSFSATGLPAGLTISSAGVISGSPSQSGTFSVTITVNDPGFVDTATWPPTSSSKTLSLTIGSTVAVTTSSLAAGAIGQAYTATLAASGGTAPYTFTATGLPAGLAVSGSSITGTPTQSGTFSVDITATDNTPGGSGGPYMSAPRSLTLVIGQGTQSITFAKPADVVFASGLTVPLVASATSGLPVAFASLTPAICTVSGTTATILAAGTCTIRASQAGNASYAAAADVTQSFAVNGSPGLTLAVSASPAGLSAVGQTVTYTYKVSNSGNVPVTALSVTDSRVSNIVCAATTLAVAASTTCTGTTVSTAADINARGIASTATARAMFNAQAVASAAVTTTVGIDVAAVQRTTSSVIQGLLSQRANLIASNGPDLTRMHSRLDDGTLFGGNENSGGGAAGFAPSRESLRPAMRGNDGFGARATGSGSGLTGTLFDRFERTPLFPAPVVPGLNSGYGSKALSGNGANAFDPGRALPFAFSDNAPGAPQALWGRLTGNADDTMGRFGFASSLSQIKTAAESAEFNKSGLTRSATKKDPIDIWFEGTFSYYNTDRIDGRRTGQAGLFMGGIDYVVRPGLLVGIMGQYDMMADQALLVTQQREGRGWMAGPYVSARLAPNLYFDARAAWGTSNNTINPLGAFVDHFATTRALASARLTGDWSFGAWRLRPSAEILHFSESQKEYLNAIDILIPGQTYRLSRLTAGPELGYRMALSDRATLEPFVSLKAIWDFSRTQETTAAGMPVGNEGLRGRVEAGLSYRGANGVTLSGSGAYDGLGLDSYRAVQGKMRLMVPLQ